MQKTQASQIKVKAGKILFEWSHQWHDLRYTTMLCNSDSHTYNAIKDIKACGYIEVEKEDYLKQVKKRMVSALLNLLQQHEGEGKQCLEGKESLTVKLVDRLAVCYGRALI